MTVRVVLEIAAGAEAAQTADRFGTVSIPDRGGHVHAILADMAAGVFNDDGGERVLSMNMLQARSMQVNRPREQRIIHLVSVKGRGGRQAPAKRIHRERWGSSFTASYALAFF